MGSIRYRRVASSDECGEGIMLLCWWQESHGHEGDEPLDEATKSREDGETERSLMNVLEEPDKPEACSISRLLVIT